MAEEKTEEKKPTTLHEAALIIAKKAYADPEYMKRVESDTKAVVEEVLDMKLPDFTQIKLLKSTPEQLYLALPPNPEEISDELLEKVAGGFVGELFGRVVGAAGDVVGGVTKGIGRLFGL